MIPKKLSNDDCECEELSQQFKSHFMKLNILAPNHCDKFYDNSVEITKSILMKILECSPLGSVVVKYAGVFDPKKLSNDDCVKN